MPSALPADLLAFVERFNRGEYWESHEALEGAWRENRSNFYKGLILYASAFVHAQRRNPRGVLAQLRKADRELAPYRPTYLGMDIEGLLEHARRAADAVVRRPGDWSILFPPALTPRAEDARGDEPELQGG